jgi:hypothetical protein
MVQSASTSGTSPRRSSSPGLGDRGLADTGLTDQQRVVLAPPAQDLRGALDLAARADQRIDAPWRASSLRLVAKGLQRAGALFLIAATRPARHVTGLAPRPGTLEMPCEM